MTCVYLSTHLCTCSHHVKHKHIREGSSLTQQGGTHQRCLHQQRTNSKEMVSEKTLCSETVLKVTFQCKTQLSVSCQGSLSVGDLVFGKLSLNQWTLEVTGHSAPFTEPVFPITPLLVYNLKLCKLSGHKCEVRIIKKGGRSVAAVAQFDQAFCFLLYKSWH